jgi:hypothetical protein
LVWPIRSTVQVRTSLAPFGELSAPASLLLLSLA